MPTPWVLHVDLDQFIAAVEVVPAAADLDALVTRLTNAGTVHEAQAGVVVTADPWGNTVTFVPG